MWQNTSRTELRTPVTLQPYGDAPATVFDWNTEEKTLRATLSLRARCHAVEPLAPATTVSPSWVNTASERTTAISKNPSSTKGSPGVQVALAADPTSGQHLLTIRQYFVNGAVPRAAGPLQGSVEAVAALGQQGWLKGATAEQAALNSTPRHPGQHPAGDHQPKPLICLARVVAERPPDHDLWRPEGLGGFSQRHRRTRRLRLCDSGARHCAVGPDAGDYSYAMPRAIWHFRHRTI